MRATLQLTAVAVALVAALGAAPALSADRPPSLRLLRSTEAVHAQRFQGEPVGLTLGTYVGAVGGPFELRATRRGDDVDVVQIVGARDSVRVVRRLPVGSARSVDAGLRGFFEVTVTDGSGIEVAAKRAPLCLSSFERTRLDDSGPDLPRYPSTGCQTLGLARATVWGIDQGWAVAAPQVAMRLHDGDYLVRVAIAQRYVDLLDIPREHAATTVRLTVHSITEQPCDIAPDTPCEPPHPAAVEAVDAHGRGPTPAVGDTASGLPDLVALPAHRVIAERDPETGRDVIAFAATVWNAGPGPLVVEGFRRPERDLMDAYQYLYADGERVGRHRAGTLEFDDRDGHAHWHFTDFARYRLLTGDGDDVVRSGKEAFCLAPTDAIDLTLPTAVWQPLATGLGSACGGEGAIWIRELLDVGWGDTYIQSLPGQSFDITTVDNGRYVIEVATNPDGRLRERRTSNNVALLHVELGGRPGHRTVTVADP